MSNILGVLNGKEHHFLRSELETMKQVFKYVYVIPCAEGGNSALYSNYMAIASDTALDVSNQLLYHAEDGDIILTDDYCPIDKLITPYFD